MREDNKVVHGLWIGETLSPVEMLCIKSFQAQGHRFHLWTYGHLRTPPPQGTVICAAQEILPSSAIFRYRYGNEFGHGKGSLAGFSDLFRYKLLYEQGGWWTDMDVTCLRPLDFPAPYVFRAHDVLAVVGNLMKCPKASPLMKWCYKTAREQVDADNTDWLLPIRILNQGITDFHLGDAIHDMTNPDRWEIVDCYREQSLPPDPAWYAFHWMNEEWRSKSIPKDAVRAKSYLARLLQGHSIEVNYLPPIALRTRLTQRLAKFLIPILPQFIRSRLKSLAFRFQRLMIPS
ncbi:MAG: glycosyltransferase [Phaeodactylibacter sp.]|uniref:glycosyltransferase n=1 Tax=Phaeodactylibacter sp. TaxID=1940289 RepID=UPI0032EF37CF